MKFSKLLPCVLLLTASPLVGQDGLQPPSGDLGEVPEDLLSDEHVLEEFGVNQFTTPSISKIFEDLEKLHPLPYDRLKRDIPERVPRDRTQIALGLGGMIADGFLTVQAEQPLDLVDVGRAMTKRAKMLGAGMRLSENTKSLIDSSMLRDWSKLKDDLSKTQDDVQKEMVLLRDVDAAHLISLGGWLRAFEIGCEASLVPFNPEKSRVLGRKDIVDYYLQSLDTLEPRLRELEHIEKLSIGIAELRDMLDVPEGKSFSEEELNAMRVKVGTLVTIAEGGEPRKMASAPPAVKAPEPPKPEVEEKPAPKLDSLEVTAGPETVEAPAE